LFFLRHFHELFFEARILDLTEKRVELLEIAIELILVGTSDIEGQETAIGNEAGDSGILEEAEVDLVVKGELDFL
jgi:hypothetical protein